LSVATTLTINLKDGASNLHTYEHIPERCIKYTTGRNGPEQTHCITSIEFEGRIHLFPNIHSSYLFSYHLANPNKSRPACGNFLINAVWRPNGIPETNVSSCVASLGFNREDTVCLALLISNDYNLYKGVPYRLRTTVIETKELKKMALSLTLNKKSFVEKQE
jgi:hypothetical protein